MFTQSKPLRDNVENGRKTDGASLRVEDPRRRVRGVNGEILGGANPREAADRQRRNSRGRLSDSQREENLIAERGVRRAEQFDRITPRNGKRAEAAGGPFGPCTARLSTRKRKPVEFRWEGKASKGEPQERLS
jgi:hypothetical protein